MAYKTGSVNSYEELRGVLISACTAAGWSFQDGILIKGTAFVRPYVQAAQSGALGAGLLFEAGTGKSGASIVGAPMENRPRLGAVSTYLPDPDWPCAYHIFSHASPDEVYIILRHNVDAYFWACFGLSDIASLDGSGFWLAATTSKYRANVKMGFNISETGGNSLSWTNNANASGIWWNTQTGDSGEGHRAHNSMVHADQWRYPGSCILSSDRRFVNAIEPLFPLITQLPSAWNAESVLLPIRVHQGMPENKHRIVVEHRHARYVRMNNLEPEQVFAIGTERWKVFPFYRKNMASPNIANHNSSAGYDHTGTFGWAIRYDGP